MASKMPHLKAFVHVSTAYVNGNQPKGSTVPERLLPLLDEQGRVVDHSAMLASLQSMPKPEAATQVWHSHLPACLHISPAHGDTQSCKVAGQVLP